MTEGQGRASLAFFLNRLRQRRRAEAVIDRQYAGWLKRHGSPDAAGWRTRLADAGPLPCISVVMPVHDTRPDWLEMAIASVLGQFHAGWQLLIADDASRSEPVLAILDQAASRDTRIRVTRLATRGGISAASNAALALAGHEFVTFLDHDDCLAPHALAVMASELATHPDAALVFSDEDQLIEGRRARPYFKPGWNPDLLLSQNLVCHLAVYRRDLVLRLGGLRPAFDGSQDFDLALRAVAAVPARQVRHVPDVLYHWRQSAGSFSSREAPVCRDATRRALREALGPAHEVAPDPVLPQWPMVRFLVPDPAPAVTVIGGTLPAATRFAGQVDHAAAPAGAFGDVLLFLAPGLTPVAPDWLSVLVAHAMRHGVGAAGARLDRQDGSVWHAGYVLDHGSIVQSPCGKADADDPGYRGQLHLARTVSAVSGACLAVRRAVFEQAGGWCMVAGNFAAVDLCLRLAAMGLRSVWVPQARLSGAVPPTARDGADWMRARWGAELRADRYHNPNIQLLAGRVSLHVGERNRKNWVGLAVPPGQSMKEEVGWTVPVPPNPPSIT